MEQRKLKLCLGCMEMIPQEEDRCPLCGFNAKVYQGNPRCLRLGQMLGEKYLIGKVIGEGGFGITYAAWDTVLEMPVAVKEYFPSSIASRDTSYGANTINIFDGRSKDVYEQGLQRYVKEAKNLSKFHYLQGIVSVRDFFYANATAYIVMEFINGVTMKEHMRKVGKIPPEEVIRNLKPVMESLVQIHAKGIVHRDISPDNIMIQKDGSIKLIDFGAARLTENGEKSLTVMLKRGFAPEEQYRSKGNQGPWTDVYALCATMYYMMAGKIPPEAMERLLSDELVPVEQLGLPLDVRKAKAIDKGLAVRAGDRWQTVQELIDVLFGNDTPAPVLTPTPAPTPAPAPASNVPSSGQDVEMNEGGTLEELNSVSVTMMMTEDEIAPTELMLPPQEETVLTQLQPVPTTQMQEMPTSQTVPTTQMQDMVEPQPVPSQQPVPPRQPQSMPPQSVSQAAPQPAPQSVSQPVTAQTAPSPAPSGDLESSVVVQRANDYPAGKGDDLYALLHDYREDGEDYAERIMKRNKLIVTALVVVAVLVVIIFGFRSCSKNKHQNMAGNRQTSTGVLASTKPPAKKASPDEQVKGEETPAATATPVPTYKMPGLVGKSWKDAKETLDKLGVDALEYKVKETYSTKVKKGNVISQSIKKGKKYTIEDTVSLTVTVSKGEQLFKVPKVSGLSTKAAEKKLKAQKMKVTRAYSYSSTVAKGKVIEQSVNAGKKVGKGTKITITISKGKKPTPKVMATPPPPPAATSKPSTPKATKKPSSGGGGWNDLNEGSGW